MKKLIIAIMLVFGVVGAYAETSEITTSQYYVDTNAATRQDAAPVHNTNTVMTYDSTSDDGIGTKAIYDTSSSYALQTDALVTAATANTAIQNGINSEFVCANPPKCNLWNLAGLYGRVPAGYTELMNVTNTARVYLDTGVVGDVDDIEWEVRVKPSTGSWYIIGARLVDKLAIWGISGSISGNTIQFGWNGTQALLVSNITRDSSHVYYIKATAKNGIATLYVKDETANTENTKTTTYNFDSNSLPSKSFGLLGNGINASLSGNTIYMARIKKSGVTVMDYLPVVHDSDNVAGFWDTVSGTFKTVSDNAFAAGPIASYIPQNQ